LTQHLILLVTQYGLLIVGVNVLLNQIGLPVPAVPILVVAGAIGAGGNLALGPIFGWSVAACVAADCGWFLIGERYGISVLKILCRISLEPDSCVSQTQTRFEQWGINSLVIAKFVPGLSIIAPPLAGALRIGWLRFIVLSTLGAILWAGGWLAVGVLFESQIDALLGQLDRIGGIAGLIAAGLLAAYIAFKWWERMRFFETLRMARIRVQDLYELIQAGGAPIIIDVRSVTARALEPRSIPGALHVPLQEAGRHLQDLPRDRDIILYCSCPSEASAARVAKLLMNHGFAKVRPLHGGLDAWIAAGYAVATIDAPASNSGTPP
jgi:membrane protein DedA with SNARE-associated domain/rhodanese-related sulfurtransferase